MSSPVFPPASAAPFLADPVAGDLFASRLWWSSVAAHALPEGAKPETHIAAGLCLALRREGRRLTSLTTPYSQAWAPMAAPGADWHAAGRELGRLWRGAPPGQLELLDPALPGLPEFEAGLRAAGLALRRYDHVGQWHQEFPQGLTWEEYLASRPTQLRNTIRRKLARAHREVRFSLVDAPGEALDDGIAAFHTVRAGSWKPGEAFPEFDATLMREAAPLGLLRLGLLTDKSTGQPLAAQYWLLDQQGRRALVPKLFHLEAAKAASPGTVLTALMLQHLITTDGAHQLDFGRGDDAYKSLWVNDRRQRIGLLLADPRHPKGLLALARHAAGRLRRGEVAP